MCDVGGPRCEYANKWRNTKRKVMRTTKYKESGDSGRETILEKARNNFDNSNPALVKAHLRKKAKWQTKAKTLTKRHAEKLSKNFPKPETLTPDEALEQTNKLVQTFEKMKENLTLDHINALSAYSMTLHSSINPIMRGDKVKDGISEKGVEKTHEKINLIKECFQQADNTEIKTLYRHLIVPKGLKPREYAEKYFKVGERIRDKGFMSTTMDPGYIRGHAHSRRPSEYIVFQIITRKGISLQREQEQVGSVQSFEKEILLPDALNLRVVNIRRESFGIHEDRVQVHKQFNRGYYNANSIPDKFFTVVQLMDEDEIE